MLLPYFYCLTSFDWPVTTAKIWIPRSPRPFCTYILFPLLWHILCCRVLNCCSYPSASGTLLYTASPGLNVKHVWRISLGDASSRKSVNCWSGWNLTLVPMVTWACSSIASVLYHMILWTSLGTMSSLRREILDFLLSFPQWPTHDNLTHWCKNAKMVENSLTGNINLSCDLVIIFWVDVQEKWCHDPQKDRNIFMVSIFILVIRWKN